MVYDLDGCGPTYDFAQALVAAEHERVKSGYDKIKVTVMPGANSVWGYSKRWPHTQEERRMAFYNIMLPLSKMLSTCCHMVVLEERCAFEGPDVLVFGKGAHSVGRYFAAMKAGIRPLRLPGTMTSRDPSLVTITLRECGKGRWESRDSNVHEWLHAGRILLELGYKVIVVRDTRLAQVPLPDLQICPEASMYVHERARLYHRAGVNLFVSNGPAWFALACDEPVIMFRPTSQTAGKAATNESMAKYGLPTGGQIPGAPSYQKLMWCDDLASDIVRSVQEFDPVGRFKYGKV